MKPRRTWRQRATGVAISFLAMSTCTAVAVGQGEQRLVSRYSETEHSIHRLKAWAQVYLNPVGWYLAIVEGAKPSTLYQWKRNDNWRSAIALGWFLWVPLILFGVIGGRKVAQLVASRQDRGSGHEM